MVKVAGERKACDSDSLTRLQLFFKEGRKMREIPFLAGPPRDKTWVAELEKVIEAIKRKLQTLPGFPAETAMMCMKFIGQRGFLETLGWERAE